MFNVGWGLPVAPVAGCSSLVIRFPDQNMFYIPDETASNKSLCNCDGVTVNEF